MSHTREFPALTVEEMREVDRLMTEEYGITLPQMMENAGRLLARFIVDRVLEGDPVGRRVVALAGRGGNGGGALVAARRLHAWGASVRVFTTAEVHAMAGVPRRQADSLRRMGIRVDGSGEPRDETVDVVIDGIIGYSLAGVPRGRACELIRWANVQRAPVVALDTPSGMDPGTGQVPREAVRAVATLTLALPKKGLYDPGAAEYVGELHVADLGVPPEVYAEIGLDVGTLFADSEVVRLR